MTKVQFVNQESGGFLEEVEVPEGQTVQEFLAAQMPDADLEEFTVTVDRDEITADHVLQEGQRVSIAPIKVAGA